MMYTLMRYVMTMNILHYLLLTFMEPQNPYLFEFRHYSVVFFPSYKISFSFSHKFINTTNFCILNFALAILKKKKCQMNVPLYFFTFVLQS